MEKLNRNDDFFGSSSNTVSSTDLLVADRQEDPNDPTTTTSPDPDMICPLKYCPIKVFDCLINYNCNKALHCNQNCMKDPVNQIGCNLICSFQYGYKNYAYHELLQCMSTNKCLPVLPENGKCLAPKDNTTLVQNITSLEQIQGKWWIIKGLNCGFDKNNVWTGGFDAFPCQYDNFIPKAAANSNSTAVSLLRGGGGNHRSSGSSTAVNIASEDSSSSSNTILWYDEIGYCGGNVLNKTSGNNCTTPHYIQTVAHVTIPVPGILHHEYLDAPLLPQIENWYILSWPHPSYMLYVYCGSTPTGKYNGGSVVTRYKNTTVQDIPKWVERIFAQVAKDVGFDYYNDMCTLNNTKCTN